MSETTRDRLLNAAEELLDSGGQSAVTLREVGRRAGVSHNAPYKHFSSKESLLAGVAARELWRWQALYAAAETDHADPAQVLRVGLRGYVTRITEHPEHLHLVFGPWSMDHPDLVEAAGVASQQMQAVVIAAQEFGALPQEDPERLGALLRAAATGAASLQSAGHLSPTGKGRSDAPGLIDALLDHLATAARSRSDNGG